jgi:galacturan 1,4-alpha-galacturonidase
MLRFLHITPKKRKKKKSYAKRNPQNGSPTGTPTTGVPITGLTVSGVTGTVASSGTNVYILCGKGSCSGWTWTGNKVTGGKTSTSCENVPSGASC